MILPSDQFQALTCLFIRICLYSCPTEATGAEHRAHIIPDNKSVAVAQEDLESSKGALLFMHIAFPPVLNPPAMQETWV